MKLLSFKIVIFETLLPRSTAQYPRTKRSRKFCAIKEATGAVIINGHFTGGVECFIQGAKMKQELVNLTA